MDSSLNSLFQEAAASLARYLEEALPPLFDDWWNEAVVNALSFQQRRRVAQQEISSLHSLDLAALLRVLDQNWYRVSTRLSLTREARHFVKEMQTVRNRWAHSSPRGLSIDDIYRDLDTLQRFATVIEADDDLLVRIHDAKASLLSSSMSPSARSETDQGEVSQIRDGHCAEFEPGQLVALRSNPAMLGAVVSVMFGERENRFTVFIDGKTQTYYASQLEAREQQETESDILSCEAFHAYLTALQIRHPGLSTLYSLNSARIDFIPYQFRPVLKFMRSDRPRFLIADGVGVGKTIEAGLILRELQARRDVRSVLIICPRPLVTERKWQIEMKRFGERFTHLDGGMLRYCVNEMDIEGVWPEQYQKVIVPYSLFSEALLYGSGPASRRQRTKGILDLDPPPRFDLVIVDEAHHIRNEDTYNHGAVRFFCDHAEAVLFLTATPIQLGSHDLYVLLNTLRPDLVIDQESYEHMAEPNPFINRAVELARAQEPQWTNEATRALDQAAKTPWGQAILRHNPDFRRICGLIEQGQIGLEDRVQLITDLESLHTFSGIINRTRRRDIGEFTIRSPETVVVEFTPSQKQLHEEILLLQADVFRRLHGDANVTFMMTTIRRQSASCLFGLVPFLDEILNRHLDELAWEEADDSGEVAFGDAIDRIELRIRAILDMARDLEPHDPKLDALRNILREKQKLPNKRVMLFSSFRHTLYYLYEHLQADGFRVGVVHGGTSDEDRVAARNRFEMQPEQDECLDILLFSEIGCEGLDYQFCDCIVNYDLPWNPMRIEQRIGRIDRWGQESEKVAIYNLVTPGTVDADIYDRCLMRIGVFNSALGASEEILGEITRQIRGIAEDFTLTAEERGDRLQQLADNKIRLLQEQDELEKKQYELFGLRLPQDHIRREIEQASSHWLSPSSIHGLTAIYLQHALGREQQYILGEGPLKTLRLSQDSRNKLLADLRGLPRQNTLAYRRWERWLKGGNPHLPITFASDCATRHPEAAFIMPLHPLAKQAAMAFARKKRVFASLNVESNVIAPGRYEFAIYQWQFHGVREDLVLQPVAFQETVTENLPELLEIATGGGSAGIDVADAALWESLDAQHHKLWSRARARHQQKSREQVEYRRESLATSHRARISLLEEQLDQTSDESIQKMRRSQIARAEADYARRSQELDMAIERADITAEVVAYGVIKVNGGDTSDAE